jgi:quinone-modifying oxidoreductase subunit QmoC
MVPNPKKLPILLGIPAVIFIIAALLYQSHIRPRRRSGSGRAHFINNYIVDIIMIPTFFRRRCGVFAHGAQAIL